MRFEVLMASSFASPEPSYEFTRDAMVKTVNEYISSSLTKCVMKPSFGLSGTIAYPSSSPVPLSIEPGLPSLSGQLVGFTPGKSSRSDYDAAAAKSRDVIGSFWPNFFELIGKAILRSSLTVCGIAEGPSQTSVRKVCTSASLLSDGSCYKSLGNLFSTSKFLSDWRSAGELMKSECLRKEVSDPSVLWGILGKRVGETARSTSQLWISYEGLVKLATVPEPGMFTGFIHGMLDFD